MPGPAADIMDTEASTTKKASYHGGIYTLVGNEQ